MMQTCDVFCINVQECDDLYDLYFVSDIQIIKEEWLKLRKKNPQKIDRAKVLEEESDI